MKRTRHLIWIFPLVILAAVSVLYQVGGSELTRALLRKEIAKLYGVSEATVESYERRLPKDWKIGDPIELLESDPHEHSCAFRCGSDRRRGDRDGVNSALLRRNFQVIADTSQLFNTAVALAVPWEPGKGEEDAATRVNIKLRRKNGALVANTFLELFSRQHTALFLTDLFPDLEGIEEFEGWMELATSNSSDYVIALSLRSAVEKLTSVPVFQQQHAFSPSLKLEFAQRLAGTSPSLHWTLHQRNGDLAIQAVQVRIPGATLANTDLDPGVSFGFGYLKIAERAIYLSAASAEEPLGEGKILGFDMISAGSDDMNRLASGTITEMDGDLVIQWQFANNPALTFVGRDTDMEIFVDPGVLTVPPGPEFEIITEFESVSLSAEEVRPVRRRTRQTIMTGLTALVYER